MSLVLVVHFKLGWDLQGFHDCDSGLGVFFFFFLFFPVRVECGMLYLGNWVLIFFFVFFFWENVGSVWQLGFGGEESYPERPDEADCIHYLRTGYCGYGSRCRFNHPRDRSAVISI